MIEIHVARVVGLSALQDGGRPGRAHEGIPIGGALDREGLARANRAVGNPDGACAVERFGGLTLLASHDVRYATESTPSALLRAGHTLELPWDRDRRVRYVAFAGGLEGDMVFGGLGTMLGVGLGGHKGRGLKRGDVLSTSTCSATSHDGPQVVREFETPIGLLAGPDLDAFAPDALTRLVSRAWTISPRSSRSGTRLEGGRLAPRSDAPASRTTPTFPGLIELPEGGEPIVLGPDGPTTGGYPIVAVVAESDLDRFHAIPIGQALRFEPAGSRARGLTK